MLFTGLALAGGTLTLGVMGVGTQFYRARQPKPNLATMLRPNIAECSVVAQNQPQPVASRTVALGGLAAGGSLLLLASANGLTPLVLINGLVTVLRTSRYGPLLYIAIDTVRPITFFPDTLMTVASGLLFGPVKGLGVSVIGNSTSALLAYGVGQKVRQSPDFRANQIGTTSQGKDTEQVRTFPGQAKVKQMLARYGARMQEKPFTSMLLMHCIYLHYDLANFLAGYLGLARRPFLFGTLLGSLPGTTAGVLAGASLHGSTIGGVPRFNPAMLATSGLMVATGLGVAYILRKREADSEALDGPFQAIANVANSTEGTLDAIAVT